MAEMKKYQFRYRLTTKSSLATIANAVRALGYDMTIGKRGFNFGWFTEGGLRGVYHSHFALDENVPEWLNKQLEEHELLAPEVPEP